MTVAIPASHEAAAVISGTTASVSPITLNALIDEYLKAYDGRDKTRHARVGWWRSRLGDRLLASITDEDVFQALQAYANAPARVYAGLDANGERIWRSKGKTPSAGSINRHHTCLSALFKWAVRARILPRGHINPARLIERQRESSGVVRFLTDQEREKLLEAAKASKWERLYLLVLMALVTGARRGELGRLTWGDIDWSRRLAHVRRSKNGESRALPLTPAVVDELRRFESKRLQGLIFGSRVRPKQPYNVQIRWDQAVKAAGLRGFRFHDLRHTCGSFLAQSGASILEVADVLGHKDLKMTRRYSHLTVDSKAAVVNRVLGDIR